MPAGSMQPMATGRLVCLQGPGSWQPYRSIIAQTHRHHRLPATAPQNSERWQVTASSMDRRTSTVHSVWNDGLGEVEYIRNECRHQ
jgi:hypothetical protein